MLELRLKVTESKILYSFHIRITEIFNKRSLFRTIHSKKSSKLRLHCKSSPLTGLPHSRGRDKSGTDVFLNQSKQSHISRHYTKFPIIIYS